jgi:hypothetical protein
MTLNATERLRSFGKLKMTGFGDQEDLLPLPASGEGRGEGRRVTSLC